MLVESLPDMFTGKQGLACTESTFCRTDRTVPACAVTPLSQCGLSANLEACTGVQDLEACVWLEETLKKYRRILLMVSHSQVGPQGGRVPCQPRFGLWAAHALPRLTCLLARRMPCHA